MIEQNKIDALSTLDVLYVEDDEETREELKLVLRGWFKNFYCAENGEQGLALYKKYAPDIVISDIQMPKMNGLSMSEDIRLINPIQEIIILSAYNDVEYLFKALDLGIKHYITKPICIERLVDKLLEISRQINLENEIKNQNRLLEQYKLLVDEKAIVAKIDLEGAITYANQQFCNLSGYSQEELIGQHYRFTLADDNDEKVLDELKQSILKNNKWQGILKKSTKAGISFIVDVTIVAIIDEHNNPQEYVALMLDMTEVYEKFEHLSLNLQNNLETKQHYLHEYEQAIELGTSLCVLDPDGKIISANQNFSSTLDCHKEDLIGNSFYDMIIDEGDFKNRTIKKILNQGYSSKIIRISAKPGVEKTLSTVIVGIHDQQGGLHSLMSLNQDISEAIKLNNDIIETQKEMIYIMGEVVENRCQETGLHIKRVAQMSEFLATQYGLSTEHAQMIKIASPMHDIGKIGIPDDILQKRGKLNSLEFNTMKKHAEMGYQMLNKLDRPLIKMAATIAHEHHEHYNGKGYPLGIAGDEIAIEARIVALVDVFDALSSKRSYKEAWTDEKIKDYLISHKGTKFDPELVDLFLENINQILTIRNQLQDYN